MLYPLSLRIGAKQPIGMTNIPITFDGTNVALALTTPVALGLDVPGGGGEYKDRHNLAAGFDTGNNLGCMAWHVVVLDGNNYCRVPNTFR